MFSSKTWPNRPMTRDEWEVWVVGPEEIDRQQMLGWEERAVFAMPTRLTRQMTPAGYLRYRMRYGHEYT